MKVVDVYLWDQCHIVISFVYRVCVLIIYYITVYQVQLIESYLRALYYTVYTTTEY